MTNTDRRALLVTLATAQAAFSLPTLATASPVDAAPLAALQRAAGDGGNALLERAATFDPDREFRAVCVRALVARRGHGAAWLRYHEANEAAERAAPFPDALMVSRVHRAADFSETRRWRERWAPARDAQGWALQALAVRRVREAGGTIEQARADLRAEFDAWSASFAAERKARNVPALLAAAESATDAEDVAMAAVRAYSPRSPETLLTKLLLIDADGAPFHEPEHLQAIIADVVAALSP